MARPEEDQTASFMMFGLGEFSSQLCMPKKFVAKYRQVTNQVSMELETDAGKSWEVKIKKDHKNEEYYMKEGWQELMKENEIDDTDFLIFRLVGDSTFNVKIYRSDGCLKDPTSPTSSEIGGEDESEIESERGRGGPPKKKRGSNNNPLYFEKRLKSYQKSRVSLPQEFSRAADMKDKAYVRMEFVATHHCERVVVDARPSRFDLAKGWFDFRVANNLEYEKNYSFEFKPNENAIHVKKVEN